LLIFQKSKRQSKKQLQPKNKSPAFDNTFQKIHTGKVLQRLKRLPLIHYRWILVATLVIFVTVGVTLFWADSSSAEQAVTKATQYKLLVMARATARSTERMLAMFKLELTVLERKDEIKNLNTTQIRTLLTEVLTTVNLPIAHQLGLISKDGTLLVVVNKEGDLTGQGESLADRSYFQWAKTAKEGDFFLSEPLVARAGSNKGKWVVVLITPIVSTDGSFSGGIYASIRLEDLTTGYIDALKVTPTTVGYVIDENGMVLSGQPEDLVGTNIKEYAQREKWKGYETYLNIIDQAVKKQEGVGDYFFAGTDKNVKRWVTGYAPAQVDGDTIMIITAVPFEWTLSLITDFYKNQIIWLVFLISMGTLIAFLWISGLYLARYDGYNHGLKDGANFKKERTRT
jgi:hypothetical protein